MDVTDAPRAKRRCQLEVEIAPRHVAPPTQRFGHHEHVQTGVRAELLEYISGCLQRRGQVEAMHSFHDNLELLKACEVFACF